MGKEKKMEFPERNPAAKIKRTAPKAVMGAAAAMAGGAAYANASQEEISSQSQARMEEVEIADGGLKEATISANPAPEDNYVSKNALSIEKEGPGVEPEDLQVRILQLLSKAQTLHNTIQNF